jgi:hypothetical protein
VKRDRITDLERTLRADAGGNALAAVILRALAQPGRMGELCQQLEQWADDALTPAAEPTPSIDEGEIERAFAAAEPEVAQMITPDTVAEEATLLADPMDDHSPLASSGAFATRTMAELLERQGDRRGAARIRAALGDPDLMDAPAPGNTAVIAVLEQWLDNARRLRP